HAIQLKPDKMSAALVTGFIVPGKPRSGLSNTERCERDSSGRSAPTQIMDDGTRRKWTSLIALAESSESRECLVVTSEI
ncbi:hypothetical protein BaRGS_00036394, partial [Batillaria attramentaria]